MHCSLPYLCIVRANQHSERVCLGSRYSSSSLPLTMLDQALSNRLHPPSSTSHAPLFLISDSLLQPALLVLRQFIQQALINSSSSTSSSQKDGRVVLLCFEQDPRRVLPPSGTYDERRVRVLDASFDSTLLPSLPSTSRASGPKTTFPTPATLLTDVLAALTEDGEGEEVAVAVDSVNALQDFLAQDGGAGEVETVRVLKRVLEGLRGRKGSRLIAVHHSDFPPSPPLTHLTLHPSSHIELLSRDYGLSFPSSSSSDDEEIDPRTKAFLESLAHRAVGDPFVRPEGAEEVDGRVALDALGAGVRRAAVEGRREGLEGVSGGGCVVEYEVRGLEGPSTGARDRRPSPRGAAPSAATAAKKLVRWGLVGARAREVRPLDGAVDVRVEECALGSVLDKRRMGVRAGVGGAASTPPIPSPSTFSTPAPPPSASSTTASDSSTPLPFSLSLTPSQRLARSLVSNPFAGADKPIYGEEGYAAPVLPGTATATAAAGGGGGIEYTPDRGDDWDDEDPDEDLEL
uniref:Elongator complex protein 5 n=1 Tax=Rhodotorula toruloides TaxID=5286 RepID=A0A0K3CI83_RHOTO